MYSGTQGRGPCAEGRGPPVRRGAGRMWRSAGRMCCGFHEETKEMNTIGDISFYLHVPSETQIWGADDFNDQHRGENADRTSHIPYGRSFKTLFLSSLSQ